MAPILSYVASRKTFVKPSRNNIFDGSYTYPSREFFGLQESLKNEKVDFGSEGARKETERMTSFILKLTKPTDEFLLEKDETGLVMLVTTALATLYSWSGSVHYLSRFQFIFRNGVKQPNPSRWQDEI